MTASLPVGNEEGWNGSTEVEMFNATVCGVLVQHSGLGLPTAKT